MHRLASVDQELEDGESGRPLAHLVEVVHAASVLPERRLARLGT
jgi:hypothetical protein